MQHFLERVIFDLEEGQIADDNIRYVMMRADVVRTILQALTNPGSSAPHPAAAAVTRFGGQSLDKYQSESGGSQGALWQVVTHTAASLGWGVWTVTPAGDAFSVEVRNSPFTSVHQTTHATCFPIVGMLQAVLNLDPNATNTIAETDCVSMGADICRFKVAPG